jgi:hypothetical protein
MHLGLGRCIWHQSARTPICTEAGLTAEWEQNDPALGWSYRRLLPEMPSGYRLALEGGREA